MDDLEIPDFLRGSKPQTTMSELHHPGFGKPITITPKALRDIRPVIPVRQAEVGNMQIRGTPLDELYDSLAKYASDPLGFVLWAFPWGEKGTSLEDQVGPEPWQVQQLERIGERVRAGGAEGGQWACPFREDHRTRRARS